LCILMDPFHLVEILVRHAILKMTAIYVSLATFCSPTIKETSVLHGSIFSYFHFFNFTAQIINRCPKAQE